jgi:hypothetical protein
MPTFQFQLLQYKLQKVESTPLRSLSSPGKPSYPVFPIGADVMLFGDVTPITVRISVNLPSRLSLVGPGFPSAVPKPSMSAMLLIGFAGIAFLRTRRITGLGGGCALG